MNASDRPPISATAQTLKAVCAGGLIAGALDLVFALTYYSLKGGMILKVLQAIAAGVQGKAAYQGGAVSAALGVGLHFGIALGWAAIFCGLARWRSLLLRWPLIVGPLYGAAVYYAMNLAVLPLSALKTNGYPLRWEPWLLGAHLFLVGLPIVLVARRYLPVLIR